MMRAPRYQFPNEVRSTTRAMAARMVQGGQVAETPEQLEEWISREGDVREPLEDGGYGTEFTAHDLFPLLQVFITQAGGPAPVTEPPPRTYPRWLPAVGALAALTLAAAAIALLR
jgi:hypothetical protein